MRTQKAVLGGLAMTFAVLAGWASVAFACTAQTQVTAPPEAAPGATVQVEGKTVPSGGPVEIRWNGVKGSVLATAMPVDGALSVPVQIPTMTPPGVYAITLIAANGEVGRTALEVGQPGLVRTPDSSPWSNDAGRPAATAPASSGASSAGAALLAIGLVGVFAASTVAVVRRRRAPLHRQP